MRPAGSRLAGAAASVRRMRLMLLVACAGLLLGCGEVRSEGSSLSGRFVAASDSAHALTGNVVIVGGVINFATGEAVRTNFLARRRGGDLMAATGASFAGAALAASDAPVELLRVAGQEGAADAPSVCGGDAMAYVALVRDSRTAGVTLLAFAGEEPPGPRAKQSRLCGAYRYVAPDGARTRQGVLLQ